MTLCCGRWHEAACPCIQAHPVKDRSAFDKALDSYIEFPTLTDALLASLLVTLDIGEAEFAKVLSIIRAPGFNALEATLESVEDFFFNIKERRDAQVNELMLRSVSSIPQVIVDNVLEVIARSLDYEDKPSIRRFPFISFDDVKNLSLVQRNWVLPARRILGRRLCLKRPDQNAFAKMINFGHLRNPLTGPWTQSIAIGPSSTNLSAFVDLQGLFQMAQRLATCHLPALRSLCLTLPSSLAGDAGPSVNLFLASLDQFTSLEELRIDVSAFLGAESRSGAWFQTMARIPRLKRFTARNTHPQTQLISASPTLLPEPYDIFQLSPSLIALNITGIAHVITELRYTRPDPATDCFCLHGVITSCCQDFERLGLVALESSWRSVRHLGLKIKNFYEGAADIILKTDNVESIEVELYPEAPGTIEIVTRILPLSLRSITFVCNINFYIPWAYEDPTPTRAELDERVQAMWFELDQALATRIKQDTGTLRYLRVEANYVSDVDGDETENFRYIELPTSAAACRDTQIMFVLQKQREAQLELW